MLIKVKYESDVRRVEVDGNPPSYADLRAAILRLYSAYGLTEHFIIKYVDDEQDEISLTTDKELVEALNFLVEAKPRSFLRLSVYPGQAKTNIDASIDKTSKENEVVHEGVICDGCNSPIRGIRYKCGNCRNFDFCASCEQTASHDPSHVFVKIRTAMPPGFATDSPLIAAQPGVPLVPQWRCQRRWATAHPEASRNADDAANQATQHAAKPERERDSNPWSAWGQHFGRGGGFGRRGGHCGKPKGEKRERCSSRWMGDVTIPDGTRIVAGTEFEKIWRLRNDGEMAWPAGTTLTFLRGDQMERSAQDIINIEREVKPGEEVEVHAQLRAPTKEGRAVSVWRLLAPQGFRFGHRLWTDINVVTDATPNATTTTTTITDNPSAPQNMDSPPLNIESPAPTALPTPTPKKALSTQTATQANDKATSASDIDAAVDLLVMGMQALLELGFCDVEENKRALEQNHGDIVHAVQHLIGGTSSLADTQTDKA